MVAQRRRAIPAAEKGIRRTIPARHVATIKSTAPPHLKVVTDDSRIFAPILKAVAEEQTVTGVVLQPEIVDAQGDIMSADVIRKAAHKFLAAYNRVTKLGLQHKAFKKRFELLESYIAPQEIVINNKTIKEGAWIMVVKVLDSKIWQKVKEGKITGFSIGGKAKVKQLAAAA